LNRYDIVTRSNVDIDVIQMSGSFSVDISKAETVVAKNSRLVKGSVAATLKKPWSVKLAENRVTRSLGGKIAQLLKVA
jgi:hypothetical protein